MDISIEQMLKAGVHFGHQTRFWNLVSVAETQLIKAGVGKVYSSGLCSYSDARFFSARRVQRSATREFDGRLATVALLKG